MPGFLTTTLRLCVGTNVFTEIYRSSPGRAVWRFFLLTILCSILSAFIVMLVQRGEFERAGQALDEEIGAAVVTPQRISFQKEPDTPRRLKLPYIMLEYFPGDSLSRNTFSSDRVSDIGVVILPGGLAYWSRIPWKGEDVFSANLLPAGGLYAMLTSGKFQEKDVPEWGMFSGPGFAETLKNRFGSPAGNAKSVKNAELAGDDGTEAPQPVLTTGSQATRFVLSVLTVLTLMTTFFRNFLQIGMIILLVSLIQYLRASTLPKGIVYRNVLTVMIYSTFPAQIAATLFDAAGLERVFPILSFNLLFVCIFLILIHTMFLSVFVIVGYYGSFTVC